MTKPENEKAVDTATNSETPRYYGPSLTPSDLAGTLGLEKIDPRPRCRNWIAASAP